MKHEQLTGKIIEVFYDVYNELGHGFLESVYENSLRLVLSEAGLFVPPKKRLVWFRGVIVGTYTIGSATHGFIGVPIQDEP